MHRLREFVDENLDNFTDSELDEIDNHILFIYDPNFDDEYEYNNNFILTKNLVEYEIAVSHMCCGIHFQEIKLKNGQIVYFAFDYGH
jgi:hypothetical protein